jgi:hypothetical protein
MSMKRERPAVNDHPHGEVVRYYYADAARQTVGPVTFEDLRRCCAAGTVTDTTPVIEEGATTWRRYADFSSGTAAGSSASYAPPPPPSGTSTTEERVREHLAESTTRVANVAGATAQVVGASVAATFRSAVTLGERLVVYGSLTALVAFVLPWMDTLGVSMSGMGLANQVSAGIWLFPLSSLGMFFLSYLNVRAQPRDRILRARWFIACGAFWFAVSLFLTLAGRGFFGVASIGLYLTALSTAALAVGGILQVADNLRSLSR